MKHKEMQQEIINKYRNNEIQTKASRYNLKSHCDPAKEYDKHKLVAIGTMEQKWQCLITQKH